MGTEYLELFNEAIFNLKETTGMIVLPFVMNWIKQFASMA